MKVRDLAQHLAKMDPDLEVYCYTEDERFATAKQPYVLLDIHAVSVAQGTASRDENRAPMFSFENSAGARKIVTLEATADF